MMRRTFFAIGIALIATTARSENWVEMDTRLRSSVDVDSIHRGSDGYVYFRSDDPDKSDRAVDCATRTIYTIKIYVMDGYAYPNWRKEGVRAEQGSINGAEFDFVCSHG